ncbi:F0F1 ATP synthase subunit A [Candidatus Saccharibacteria bacterium]|nr:F0F1 ATP synthase subunit A [Candidatus Saccharibacteria bacterium]
MPVFGFEIEPLGAQPVFQLGPLSITNSMVFGLVIAFLLVSVLLAAARTSQLRPKSRLAFWSESLVELMLGLVTESFGDRKKAMKHFPMLLTLFIFILACNLSGLLPGIGTITYNGVGVFRAWTTDLNATAAMALLTMTVVQVHAVRTIGGKGYFHHYFTHEWWKPQNFLIGGLEVYSEFLRLITLALRLFGVIYGGEALLAAIGTLAGNFGWAAMVPITLLEIFFCIIQAYLFMMLSTTYLVMSTSQHESGHEPGPVQPVAVSSRA